MLGEILDRFIYALVIVLRRLCALLPYRSGLALFAVLGRSLAFRGGPRTRVSLENLRRAFPEKCPAEHRALLRASYANLGRIFFEAGRLDRMDVARVSQLVDIEGIEHLERAQAASRTGGVILLTAHFGSFELMAVACALRGFPVAVVHRTQSNPRLDRIVTSWRERAGVQVLRRGSAARAVLRALRDGRLVALPLDQNARRRDGIFVPFFGHDACTRDGPARLAMRFATPVVPVFIFRRADPTRHVVRIMPAVEMVPAGEHPEAAVRENVARMNERIEAAIREAPDHWVWIHRRWKTRPRPAPARSEDVQRAAADAPA